MRIFGWFRRPPVEPLPQPKSGYHYRFTGHDQAKGVQAFQRSKADASLIRDRARFDRRGTLRRVK